MIGIKPVLLPLQFILSFVLLLCCLHEVAYNEDVIVSELCKSLAVVSLLSMLAAASNNSIPQKKDTYENH
jgi:hypothetical protein